MIDQNLFVTFNVFTVTTAIAGGVVLGLALKDVAETMLEVFLTNGRINLLLRLIPLFLVVFGTAIVVAFFASAILTDIIAESPNDVWRAAGRGICNLVFVWACAFGTWLRVHNLTH